MQVKDVMSHALEEIPADATVAEALRVLVEHRGTVMAVYEEGHLQGTLTEHDIAAWQAAPGHDPATAYVREAMRSRDGYVTEDQDIATVTKLMREERLPGMVVVKDHQPIGSVSLGDLAARTAGAAASDEQVISTAMPARVFLQPIAAPSILGFFALGAAWWIVGSQMVHWFGGSTTPEYLFPFVGLFGGLMQLLAGMWAYKARDGLATIIHGMWGAFFLAYGLLFWAAATGTLSLGAVNGSYGYWFIPLAAISASCAIAALLDNRVLSLQQWALTAASIIAAVALLAGNANWIKVSGYVFMAAALIAWYLASGLLFEATYRRVILPLGRMKTASTRLGSVTTRPVEYKFGEPGVRAGQ